MNNIFERLWRGLNILGVAVLSGLFGIGATYVIMAIIGISRLKGKNASLLFVAAHASVLVAGGVAGSLVGLVAALIVVKAGTNAETAMEKKYMRRGDRSSVSWGFPFSFFFISLLLPEFERLAHAVGERAAPYAGLGICLLIIAASLVLFDRIPRSLAIPLGLLSWVLIFVAACFYIRHWS